MCDLSMTLPGWLRTPLPLPHSTSSEPNCLNDNKVAATLLNDKVGSLVDPNPTMFSERKLGGLDLMVGMSVVTDRWCREMQNCVEDPIHGVKRLRFRTEYE